MWKKYGCEKRSWCLVNKTIYWTTKYRQVNCLHFTTEKNESYTFFLRANKTDFKSFVGNDSGLMSRVSDHFKNLFFYIPVNTVLVIWLWWVFKSTLKGKKEARQYQKSRSMWSFPRSTSAGTHSSGDFREEIFSPNFHNFLPFYFDMLLM